MKGYINLLRNSWCVKILFALLLAVVTNSVAQAQMMSYFEYDGVTYTYVGSQRYEWSSWPYTPQEAVVYKCGEKAEVIIPSVVYDEWGNQHPVVGFHEALTKYNRKVVLPSSIRRIGDQAFYKASNVEIVLPNRSDIQLGEGIFYGADLTSFTFPSKWTKVGEKMFEKCKNLKEVILPSGLREIGKNAFRECSSLEGISLPEGVDKIDDGAFSYTALSSITLPSTLKELGGEVFTGCSNLTEIELPDGLEILGDRAFQNSSFSTFKLPRNLKKIGNYAFFSCSNLSSIDFPDGLEEIGKFAFSGCSNLSSIDFPDSLEEIGAAAFKNTGLTELNLPARGLIIGDNAFSECNMLKEVYVPGIIISSNAKDFCGIFRGCMNLERLELGVGNYYDIPVNIASGCTSLKEVIIPKNITRISNWAFEGCSSLKSIDGSFSEIGLGSFENCTSLEHVGLSDDVTFIGEEAFANCPALRLSELKGSFEEIFDKAFLGCTNITLSTLPKSVTKIGECAFKGCTSITKMALPDAEIGDSAFEGCTSMQEFYTGNGITKLSNNSLKGMTSLENLTLGTQLVEMSGCGIEDSQSLKRINCLSKYAPFADEFSDAVYGQASLYVPQGAEKEYSSRNPWMKFHNIVGYDFSGVEDVAAEEGIGFSVSGGVLTVKGVDGGIIEIYDMSGRLVHSGTEPTVSGLSRGFYLLKAGNRTAKIRI